MILIISDRIRLHSVLLPLLIIIIVIIIIVLLLIIITIIITIIIIIINIGSFRDLRGSKF